MSMEKGEGRRRAEAFCEAVPSPGGGIRPVGGSVLDAPESLGQRQASRFGHASEGYLAGMLRAYERLFRWEEDFEMGVKLKDILKPGLKLNHEYDFGSTTEAASDRGFRN